MFVIFTAFCAARELNQVSTPDLLCCSIPSIRYHFFRDEGSESPFAICEICTIDPGTCQHLLGELISGIALNHESHLVDDR